VGAVSVALLAAFATAVAPPLSKAAAGAPPAPSCSVCVLSPSGTSLAVTGKGNLDVTTVGVRVNSDGKPAATITSNGSIIAPQVGVVGTVSYGGKGSIQNLTTGVQAAADPFAAVTEPSLARPSPVPSEVLSGTTAATIQPGVYQDIILSGRSKLTLQPGTYVVLHSFATSGQASVTASGVTIYLACGSYPTPCSSGQQGAILNLAGQGALSLSAPVPACTPLAVYSDPANVSPLTITGNGVDNVSGGIYARSGTLTLLGNGSVFRLHSQIATGHLTVKGNGNVSVTGLPPSCTLPSPYDGSRLTLSPSAAGPDTPHTSQALVATLTDNNGNPLANQIVSLTVTGANGATRTAGTDKNGNAHFSYTGINVGSDSATATFTVGAGTVISNQATITWAVSGSVSPVSISPVVGNFYQEPSTTTAFTAQPADTPVFGQTFPDIEFNPPAGTIPHDTSGITPTTRPFTDIVTDLLGDFSSYSAAEGNGYQAGVGPMASFDAEMRGSFNVTKAGTQVFTLFRNDGYILGIGNGASGSSGNPDVNAPAAGTTPFQGYAVVAADNQTNGTNLGPDVITVSFPSAGTYPFELDYLQRPAPGSPAGGDPMTLALEVGTGTASGLNLSLGYAYGDGTSPNFPSPWQGSTGVNFVGSPRADGTWDSGALRLDNPTGSPVTLDHVTVDVGSTHFDPGFTNVVVPPHGTTILTGTGQLTSGLQTGTGGIYITGHDPDYHAYAGGNNATGAQHILQRAVSWVTYGKAAPRMLLVTDVTNPGGDESDPRLGLTAAGFSYDVADDGSSGTALDLRTVDFSNYDVIVVASDYGGWLSQSELDILNARSAGLISFVNNGGGLVALAECGCRGNGTGTTHDRFGFLPSIVSSAALNQGESGYTLSSTGLAMGLTTSDINGNASHNIFTSSGGLSPVDYDPSGNIISLTERGLQVGQSNFDTSDAAETADSSQSGGSGGAPVAGSVTLSQIAAGFPSPIGIDYYQPTNQVVVSVNYGGGQPNNFDLVDSSGNYSQFSSVSGLTDEVYMSAIRTSSCEAGFKPGDLYFGTGTSGVIARLSDNGTVLTNPWVTLPGEGGLLRGGVFQDVYCVAGGDLVVTTNAGDVWKVTAAGVATELATGVGDNLEGPTTVPNDPRYGPWAGQILVASENCGCVQSVDPNTGAHTTWSVGSGNMDGNGVGSAEAIHLVLPNQNFFGVDYGSGTLRGVPASQFAGIAGDVVVATEFPGRLVDASWNPTKGLFDTTDLLSTNASQWEGTAFAPAGLPGVPPVPTCIPATAVPQINVTINGQTTAYADTGKVLTDGGTDPDNCGGTDESQPWTAVGGAATPLPPSTSLTLSPRLEPDQVVGNTLTIETQAVDQTGQPETGQTITLNVQGANNRTLTAATDVNGLASFSYTGTSDGLDTLTATATSPVAVSNVVQVNWFAPQPSAPPPTSTSSGSSAPSVQILTPSAGETVNAPAAVDAAVTVASGQTVTSWTATWRPHGTATPTTLASGSGYPPPTLATFDPTDLAPGQYDITVSATSSGGGTGSATVTVSANTAPPPPPPVMGPTTPADGSTITAPTPVTGSCSAPSGQTISGWSVTLRPDAGGGTTTTLASGSGSPPAALTTFDPTLLTNGTYTLTVVCDASGGGTGSSSTDVAVSGQLKLGRYTTTYQDLSVPVDGFQMSLDRTYDSTDKTVGDFGVGWHVSVSNFQVSSNRALGAGGWSQYDPTCFGALCLTAYQSSAPHFVTVTWPNGRQEEFDFTPQGGSVLFPTISPAFSAHPGTDTTSTLTASEGIAGMTADGDLVDDSGNPYDPTQFTLTTASGETFVLDTTKGLVSEADTNGNTLTVDSTGLHASNGESLTWTRDVTGRITDATGPTGQKLHYGYSAAGDLADFVDTAGATTTFSYDANHDMTGSTGPDSKPIQTIGYGPDGRVDSITDASGNTVTISTTVGSRQQILTDQTGKLTSLETFDALGDILSSTQTGGGQSLTTSFTYDSAGRTLTETDPLGNLRSYTYDSYGRLASVTDANGFQTNLTYNTLGEPIVDIDPTGATAEAATYTAGGNPATVVESGLYSFNMGDNAAGKLTSLQGPGGTSTIGYDSNGHLASETDPTGKTTNVSVDASGKVLSVTDALGESETFGYASSGALTSVTTPAGTSQSVTDAYGRIQSETDALGNTITAAYYPTGQIESATDGSGRTAYTYDADGRVTSVSLPGGAGTDTYTYDAFGRLVTATNTAGDTVTNTYDADSRITAQTSSGPGEPTVTLHYAYDADGNRTALTGPAGTTAYTFDSLGHPTGVVDPSGGHFAYLYNPAGQLTGLTRPNGVDDTITYGGDGNPASIVSSLGTSVVNQVSYTYDGDGRQQSATNAAGTTTFGYDAIGRLTSATPSSGPALGWTYDPAGNITSRPGAPAGSLTYNADNQLTASPGMTYTYDASGDLITAKNTGTNATTSYTWGAPGQLLGVTGPGGTTTMGYDPLGRRTTVTTAAGTTASAYDGSNLIAQYPPGGGTQSYVNGPTLNDPLELVQPGGAKDYYLSDTLGNVNALTNSAGSTVETYAYSPYGTQSPSGSTANPLTYGGQQYDSSTGLYYDHARYYDPTSGRFLSPDPLGSSNPYEYANNSPVNFSDPTGADAVEMAFLFQYVQNEANDLVGLVNGILNYASTCAAAELSPADSKPGVACSQGFLDASILYGEIQAGADNLIGLALPNAAAYGVHALFDGAMAGSLEALDESVLPAGSSTIGCQAYNGGGYSLVGNLPSALASGAGLTGDPLELAAPTGYDFFGFMAGFLVQVLQTGRTAQAAITQGTCATTGPLG